MKTLYGKKQRLDFGGEVMVACHETSPEAQKRKEPILKLQLAMATSSINHEYARMEYDDTSCIERREELLHYMDDCRRKYDNAREELTQLTPATVRKFEEDLFFQKRTTLREYNA